MASTIDSTFQMTPEHADKLRRFWKEGYLDIPWYQMNLYSAVFYDLDRRARGLTGVILTRLGGIRTAITASCYRPESFGRLLRAAKDLGVRPSFECPEEGCLIGWIDDSRAHEVAVELAALPTEPDIAVKPPQLPERQRCRHRRPPGEGVR